MLKRELSGLLLEIAGEENLRIVLDPLLPTIVGDSS